MVNREVYTRTHDNEIWIHISYELQDEITLKLTEKEAGELEVQLGFALQDIDVVRKEKVDKLFKPALERGV